MSEFLPGYYFRVEKKSYGPVITVYRLRERRRWYQRQFEYLTGWMYVPGEDPAIRARKALSSWLESEQEAEQLREAPEIYKDFRRIENV